MQYVVRFPGPNRSIMQFDHAPPLGIMSISAFIKQHGYEDIALINGQTRRGVSDDEIRQTVRRLVHASGNPWLTGVCCINMDDQVSVEQVTAIFEEVEALREEYAADG